MPTLFLYLLQSSGIMALFYLLYMISFKKETFYRYNRLLLLSAFIFSALLPLLPVPALQWPQTSSSENTQQLVYVSGNGYAATQTGAVTTTQHWWDPLSPYAVPALMALYISIAVVLLLVHAMQLLKIKRLINKGDVFIKHNIRYVQLPGLAAPFSFSRNIFFDPNAYEPSELQHILKHEEAHVRQRHSADLLLSSVYCCICWINPFAWLCKKALQLNLEFLADEAAIQAFNAPVAYQYSLLKISTTSGPVAMGNHFSTSFIKNRILMMNKTQSPRLRTWRYLLLLPVLALTAGLLSATTTNAAAESGADKYLVTENGVIHGIVTHLTTDQDLADMKAALAAKDIHLSISELKRNAAGEVTNMRLKATDKRSGLEATLDESPILSIFFYFGKNESGIGPTPFKQTPKNLVTRAISESNGITTDSTFLNRFAGGKAGYTKFLARNIRYPRHCQENNIVGNVMAQYKILPSGEVTNAEVLISPDKMMGEEVVRIIKMLPAFKPDATGKTVIASLTIAFVLQVSGKTLKGPDTNQEGTVVVVGYGKN